MVSDRFPIVEQLKGALKRGDLGRIPSFLARDATLVVSGGTGLSGPYRGREAIVGFLGKLAQLSRGTFRFRGERLLSDGEVTIVVGHIACDRRDRHRTAPAILEVTVRDEEVVQLRAFHDGQPGIDGLCSLDDPVQVGGQFSRLLAGERVPQRRPGPAGGMGNSWRALVVGGGSPTNAVQPRRWL